MKGLFSDKASGQSEKIAIVESVDLATAQHYADHERKLGLKKLEDHADTVFPEERIQSGIQIVGAGPSLNETNNAGQTLLEEMDQTPAYIAMASMSVRLLNHNAYLSRQYRCKCCNSRSCILSGRSRRPPLSFFLLWC